MKLITAITLCILASPSFSAMYKWTDEQGNTHYGEQPPNYQKAQNIAPPPPAASSSKGSSERMKALRTGILKQTEDGEKAKIEAQQKASEDKEMKAYCAQLRKRIKDLQSSTRVSQQDQDGNVNYLDTTQIQKQIKETQQRLAKDCS